VSLLSPSPAKSKQATIEIEDAAESSAWPDIVFYAFIKV